MSLNGYVKIFRQLKEWEWYDDTNVKIVFLDLLLIANFKDTNWKGQVVKRGQTIIGQAKYSKSLGLTVQELRTVFKKLKSTGEITTRATSKNTVVTLVNFDVYQDEKQSSNTQNNELTTSEQQTNNEPTTHEQQQRNNEKKEKKDKNEKKYIYIEEFQKIEKGESMRITELDKRFHFALFPEEWSDNLKNETLGMWRYLESNCDKPQYWGKIGTITTQLNVLKSSLNQFTESEVIQAFQDCKFNSRVSWNKYLVKKEDRKSYKSNDSKPTFSFNQQIFNGA